MYVVSPLTMVNSYKTNNDYYRVSAVQRSSAGAKSASKQPATNPFLRSAYSQFAQTEAAGLAGLLRSANNVKQSAQAFLTGNSAAALSQRAIVISKPTAVQAEVKNGADLKSIKVKVNVIAIAQQNKGDSAEHNASTPIQAGWNEFSLKQDGETSQFKVFIGSNESFEQTLGKIKSAVNRKGNGVQASIVDDGGTKLHLELTSKETGNKKAFTLEDLTGNAVSALGLNNKQTTANNASYIVNGEEEITSETNHILLDQGDVKATLLKADSEEITLTTQADAEAIVKPIKQLVADYNQFHQLLDSTPGYLNRSVVQGLERAAKPHALEELGITEKADGTLQFNEVELKNQVIEQYSTVNRSIGGVSGLASSLSQSFSRLDQLPSEALFQLQGSSLKPYGQYRSQLQAYLPVPMSGLLLDRNM